MQVHMQAWKTYENDNDNNGNDDNNDNDNNDFASPCRRTASDITLGLKMDEVIG